MQETEKRKIYRKRNCTIKKIHFSFFNSLTKSCHKDKKGKVVSTTPVRKTPDGIIQEKVIIRPSRWSPLPNDVFLVSYYHLVYGQENCGFHPEQFSLHQRHKVKEKDMQRISCTGRQAGRRFNNRVKHRKEWTRASFQTTGKELRGKFPAFQVSTTFCLQIIIVLLLINI